MYENMIVIDREAPESLQKQIRRQIAIGIVNRQYPLHRPLPSIRQLSLDLGVSVTTVTLAYEALKQDGFVEARNRSGFYVNQDVLTDLGHALKREVPADMSLPPSKLDYGVEWAPGRMYSEYDKSAAFAAWQMPTQSASLIDTQRSFALVPFGLTAIFPSPTDSATSLVLYKTSHIEHT